MFSVKKSTFQNTYPAVRIKNYPGFSDKSIHIYPTGLKKTNNLPLEIHFHDVIEETDRVAVSVRVANSSILPKNFTEKAKGRK